MNHTKNCFKIKNNGIALRFRFFSKKKYRRNKKKSLFECKRIY